MPIRRLAALAAVAALITSACTSSDEPAGDGSTTTAPPTTLTTTTTNAPAPLDVDRLVVVDSTGRVVTVDRDGSDERVLSADGELPFQPVWSPDGRRIAYASRAASPGFVVVDAEGGEQAKVATGSASFYFSWSPQSDRLGSLRNGPTGIVFEMIDVGAEVSVREVDTGQPFYFAWSPAGDELVAHVGANRLDVLSPLPQGPDPEALAPSPGLFRAPQWLDGGVVSVLERSGGAEVAFITRGGDETPIARVQGIVQFEASRDGRLLAVMSFLPDGGDSVSVLFQTDEALPTNRLHVVDTATGEATQVTTEPALAFFWSPDGSKLLVMGLAGEPGQVRWSVWEDGVATPGPAFRPSATWIAEFLPFFDQYAQSMRLWSPDSSAYAFAGRIGDDTGIWVAPADGGEPALVSDGSWVSWSQN
jgi:TolB protein